MVGPWLLEVLHAKARHALCRIFGKICHSPASNVIVHRVDGSLLLET